MVTNRAYNHGPKSRNTFAFLWRFPSHTGPDPSLPPQTMLDACIQNLFRVSTLYRVGWGGGGRTARKFWKWCTVLRGIREMTEKYEYCSTVPRTFVQDCRSKGNQIPGQKYRNHWRLKERKGQPSNIPKSRSRPGTNEWIKNKMITRPITTELFINSTLSRMTYWKTKRESWWRISLCKCILATCINLGHLAVNQPDELEEKKSSFM